MKILMEIMLAGCCHHRDLLFYGPERKKKKRKYILCLLLSEAVRVKVLPCVDKNSLPINYESDYMT